MDVVRGILKTKDLSAASIEPVEYDEACPFPYNNFIYKIQLVQASVLDAGNPPVSTLILRLSNPRADGLNNANRVQNEVASILLARSNPDLTAIVPAIYAWQAGKDKAESEKDFGWVLMEYKPGVSLDSQLEKLTAEKRGLVLGQISRILAALQHVQLPPGVAAHGGLTIDDAGNTISAQPTTLKGGPWPRYQDFWRAKFENQLADADSSPVLKGWRQDDLRGRIDRFLDEGLTAVLSGAGVDTDRLCLIHGDLTTNNILFDPETNQLTGLVDFDFSFVSHPAHEFFVSLHDVGGNTSGGHGPDPTGGKLTAAILSGDFDVRLDEGEGADDAAKILDQARDWDEAVHAAGGTRPSEIAGIATLDKLRQLEGLLAPFRLVHPFFLKKKTPEELEQDRLKAAETLAGKLEEFGF